MSLQISILPQELHPPSMLCTCKFGSQAKNIYLKNGHIVTALTYANLALNLLFEEPRLVLRLGNCEKV